MSEVLAAKAFDWAVGEVLSAAITKLLASRIRAGRLAVVSEFARGDISLEKLADRDDLLAGLIALAESLRRGAAIENLRLIARVIANKANAGNDGEDEVLMWAEMISSLTSEERFFLAVLAKCEAAATETSEPETFESEARVSELFSAEIVDGSPFGRNYERVQSTGLGLMRTGCVKPVILGSGGFRFAGTSKLRKLSRLAELIALADELKKSDQ